MNQYLPWPQTELDKLSAAFMAGKSAAQIGREMGRTDSAIIDRLRKIGLKFPSQQNAYFAPKRTKEKEDKLRKLWIDGVMVKIISHELGVSKDTISRWRKELNLPQRLSTIKRYFLYIGLTPEEEKIVRRNAPKEGMSYEGYIRHLIRAGAAS